MQGIKKILSFLKDDLKKVEESINLHFKSDVTMIPRISSYISNGGGKRFRPILLLICSRLCGYDGNKENLHILYSCVMEYIHAASLLHDDVVDSADMRRGNPSVNVKWGNEASVLVGDYLFSKSFVMVAEKSDPRIIRAISQASMILAEGEVKQLMNIHNIEISEKEYIDIIERKTASLIATSCKIGAIIGNTSDQKIEALSLFGKNIGIAFQLIDDVLDYISNADALGKPVANDLKEGKITLPLIYLYQNSTEGQKKEINRIVASNVQNDEEIKWIMTLMNSYGAVEYATAKAKKYIEDAKKQLMLFKSSEYFFHLNSIADYVIDRKV